MTKKIPNASERTERDLGVLVGDLNPPRLTVQDLQGQTHGFAVETFSTFKTAQVLRMLAALRKQVNVADILKQVATLAGAAQEVTYHVCPHCRERWTGEQEALRDLAGRTLLCHKCLQPFPADGAPTIAEHPTRDVMGVLVEILPPLFEVVPDLALDFAALAILPNATLEKAYLQEGGIAKLISEKRTWLLFHFDAGVPLQIINAFVPAMGVDFLVRNLGQLGSLSRFLSSNPNTLTGS